MDYRLVLSNLKIVELQFLVTVDNEVSCHVTLGNFQRWLQDGKCSLIYQRLISNEKTKVTQFARLCKIMTCLFEADTKIIFAHNFVTNDTYKEELQEQSNKQELVTK